MSGRIFVPLKQEPYLRFCNGLKTVEVRRGKSPVAAQVRKAKPGAPVLLRWGYSNDGTDLDGKLGRVWTAPCVALLPKEAIEAAALTGNLAGGLVVGDYFGGDEEVLAFECLDLYIPCGFCDFKHPKGGPCPGGYPVSNLETTSLKPEHGPGSGGSPPGGE